MVIVIVTFVCIPYQGLIRYYSLFTTFSQSVLNTLWHLLANTLTASLTSTSGGSCPVLSTVNMKWSFFFRSAIFSPHPG